MARIGKSAETPVDPEVTAAVEAADAAPVGEFPEALEFDHQAHAQKIQADREKEAAAAAEEAAGGGASTPVA